MPTLTQISIKQPLLIQTKINVCNKIIIILKIWFLYIGSITVGFDEVVYNDVVFLLDSGQTEINISRNIMTQRSPYFRSLIKSLDLTKVNLYNSFMIF